MLRYTLQEARDVLREHLSPPPQTLRDYHEKAEHNNLNRANRAMFQEEVFRRAGRFA